MSRRRPTSARPWTPLRFSHLSVEDDRVYENDRYSVTVTAQADGITHLSIHSHTRGAISAHDWRHFQRIKTELCGPDREGVEIYPAEDRVVDLANEYHLWVLPAGFRFPFGFCEGRHVTGEPDDYDADAAIRTYADSRGMDPERTLDFVRRREKQRTPSQ